jgi:hypothetical protein
MSFTTAKSDLPSPSKSHLIIRRELVVVVNIVSGAKEARENC